MWCWVSCCKFWIYWVGVNTKFTTWHWEWILKRVHQIKTYLFESSISAIKFVKADRVAPLIKSQMIIRIWQQGWCFGDGIKRWKNTIMAHKTCAPFIEYLQFAKRSILSVKAYRIEFQSLQWNTTYQCNITGVLYREQLKSFLCSLILKAKDIYLIDYSFFEKKHSFTKYTVSLINK